MNMVKKDKVSGRDYHHAPGLLVGIDSVGSHPLQGLSNLHIHIEGLLVVKVVHGANHILNVVIDHPC